MWCNIVSLLVSLLHPRSASYASSFVWRGLWGFFFSTCNVAQWYTVCTINTLYGEKKNSEPHSAWQQSAAKLQEIWKRELRLLCRGKGTRANRFGPVIMSKIVGVNQQQYLKYHQTLEWCHCIHRTKECQQQQQRWDQNLSIKLSN